MANLLLESNGTIPTEELTAQFFERVARVKGLELRVKPPQCITWEDIEWADSYVAVRSTSRLSLRLMRLAKEAGLFCVYFIDDNLAEPPADRIAPPSSARICVEMARYSDVILTSSAALGRRLCELAGSTRHAMVHTVVDGSRIKPVPEIDAGRVRFVYAAGVDHAPTFTKYVLGPLTKVCRRHPGIVSITFVAVAPEVGDLARYADVEYVRSLSPVSEYRRFMTEHDFDIGLAPLDSGGFSQYKYFNKFVEYTIMGIAGIYSECSPYTDIVKSAENGLLVQNDAESWESALEYAVSNLAEVKALASEGAAQLSLDFSEEAIVARLMQDVPELRRCKRRHENGGEASLATKWALSDVRFRAEKACCYAYLLFKYAQAGDKDALLKKIMRHLGAK